MSFSQTDHRKAFWVRPRADELGGTRPVCPTYLHVRNHQNRSDRKPARLHNLPTPPPPKNREVGHLWCDTPPLSYRILSLSLMSRGAPSVSRQCDGDRAEAAAKEKQMTNEPLDSSNAASQWLVIGWTTPFCYRD